DYKLDGPYDTIESAKTSFQTIYYEKFGVQWTTRETTVSEKWTYELVTYETYEVVEEIEEIVEEDEAQVIIAHEREIRVDEGTTKTETTTVTTQNEVVIETTQEEVVVVDEEVESKKTIVTKTEDEQVTIDTSVEKVVKEVEVTEASRDETIETTKHVTVVETGVVAKPAVNKNTSWFRKIATHAGGIASGAGAAAAGALTKADGVWKRTVEVLTLRKAKVDQVAPIAKTSYVYFENDEVYDSVLVEKTTGVTYITQLLFDASVQKYYVYIRWGEKEYKLDGPHETIESAKDAFQLTYKEKFGIEWSVRETTVSEKWTYEVKTYETYEEIEYIEEIVEEAEAEVIIKKEQQLVIEDVEVKTET
ncbi:hypothetical protein BGZ94_006104, partial [Podila epigama]